METSYYQNLRGGLRVVLSSIGKSTLLFDKTCCRLIFKISSLSWHKCKLVGEKKHRAVLKCSAPQIGDILLKDCFISCSHLSCKQLSAQREKESNQITSIWSQKFCQKRFPPFQKQDKIKRERHAILNKMLLKSEMKNNSELSDRVSNQRQK